MMKIVLLLSALSAGQVLCRDAVTVDPDKGGSLTDLSGTGLTRKYCVVKEKTCNLPVIEANFAGTEFQCIARCTQRRDCFSLFYNSDRVCSLLDQSCTAPNLAAPGGSYLYRLKEGENCPAGSSPYVPPEDAFTNTFCMLVGKTCEGQGYYKSPANIKPMEECLKKCAKIKTCGMVNYNDAAGKCEPLISEACPDENLVDAPGIQNFIRLPLGVTECADNRVPPSPTAPPPTPEPEPEPEPTEEPESETGPTEADCGGKYRAKIWGEKGQDVVVGECNPGCTMSVCHCRPWGRCDGAKFTSDGKCQVELRRDMRRREKKRVYARIKCVPSQQIKVQYISSQTPDERLQCGNGYKLGDCTFFAYRRDKWTKYRAGRQNRRTSGCGVRRHRKGCNRIGRCTSTGVCFKKL